MTPFEKAHSSIVRMLQAEADQSRAAVTTARPATVLTLCQQSAAEGQGCPGGRQHHPGAAAGASLLGEHSLQCHRRQHHCCCQHLLRWAVPAVRSA
jgi:hypothetical protein